MSPSRVANRLSAREILLEAKDVGEEELKRSRLGLGFSGLAAGIAMGLSALGPAVVIAVLGGSERTRLVADLLYPLGFIAVVIGRAQLFTENTLFPVILVLAERRHLRNTARLWTVVLAANVLGALVFAVLAMRTNALSPAITHALAGEGRRAVGGSFSHIFWSGVWGGWLIALMAWLVTASRLTVAQVALIELVAYVVGAAGLAHSIAGSAEILCAVVGGAVGAGDYLFWLAAAVLGNAVGGVVMVSLLNYAQVRGSGSDEEHADRPLDEIEGDVVSLPGARGRGGR